MPHNYPMLSYFYQNNTLFLESKIEEKNDNAKVDKVGDRSRTEGAFTVVVKILSVKPLPMYL